MRIKTIKTRLVCPPKDDIFEVISRSIKRISEGSILVIASKIVSIHQGRCIPIDKVSDKDELIKKEADKYLSRKAVPKGYAILTYKNKLLIPSAGIDESNVGDYYLLWPNNLNKFTKEIYNYLRKKYKVKDFGVIISDSHTVPLRRGVMGIALSYFGFRPLNDYRGKKDLFGRKFEVATTNVVDSLAVSAVLEMGEGTEQTPLAMITELPFVKFSARPYKPKDKNKKLEISWKEDLYGPLLNAIKWKK
ncbi:MAG: coenzyme F420-0:L-glutamate ligase [Candidatus Kerfeldbacteria bacterium]